MPLTRTRALVASLAVLVVATSLVPVGAAAQSTEQRRLDRARERIARLADEIESAESQASRAGEELAAVDARLREVEEAVNDAARALDRQGLLVVEAEEQLARLEARANEIAAGLERRAVSMYKHGSQLPFEVVLESGDVSDALERTAFLRVITAADQANYEEAAASRVAVNAQRDLLEAERVRLAEMKQQQEELLVEVERIRATKAAAAAAARDAVSSLESEKEELEGDAERLKRIIKRRQQAARTATVSAPSRSGYSWPLCGIVTSEFGYRWGRRHEGIDIDDNRTKTIVASKGGTVIYAGWQGGYGQITMIDHHDGVVTAYAHQASIGVSTGQSVSRGQAIGVVGNTGHSTGSHLHFETRVNGSAVNPRNFLGGGC